MVSCGAVMAISGNSGNAVSISPACRLGHPGPFGPGEARPSGSDGLTGRIDRQYVGADHRLLGDQIGDHGAAGLIMRGQLVLGQRRFVLIDFVQPEQLGIGSVLQHIKGMTAGLVAYRSRRVGQHGSQKGESGGEAIHGFGLASRYYFGQPIQELRIDQLAMLVGMVKGPSYYNPIRYPERTKERRDLVLRLLMQQNMLTSEQYEQAVSRSLDTQSKPRIASRQPAYFQQLSIELKEKVGERFKAETGLRVFTSLDPVSQSKMEQAIAKKIPELAKRGGKELEAAAVAVDRHSGEIRAMVGGKRVGYEGFNRALNASRPIGSLVKPAIYLTALEQPEKYNLGTTLHDTPLSLKSSKGNVWTPRNYDRKYRGDVPLYIALAKSLNVPTVRLGMALGIPEVSDTLERLGVNKDEIRPVPSMFLGSFSLTPFEVAQMYQTLTNSGKRAKLTALRSVMDMEGNVLYQSLPRSSRAVDEQAAWLTTYAMKQGVAQGTGRFLQSQFGWAALAGKTGTSNDNRDSWFVGVDGREVTTIWLGRDDNKSVHLTGSSGALRVYAEYLKQRIPERLELPWPREITTLGFKPTSDGGLEMNCRSDYKLPVWDKTGQIKQQCEKKSNWLNSLFDW